MCQATVSPQAKLTYAQLTYYAGKKEYCFPSQQTICEATGLQLRSVQRYIRELVDNNLIEIETRGKKQTNIYYFLEHPWMQSDTTNLSDATRQICQVHSKEESIKEEEDNMLITFEFFWDQYPRKVGKKRASQIFARIIKAVDPVAFLHGLSHYRKYCEMTDKPVKFIKHPSTWLTQECWHDDYSDEIELANSNDRSTGRQRILDAVGRTLSGGAQHTTAEIISITDQRRRKLSE
tara:strand:- start:220 stop:924 length:705 start_codon:yes stop_codon:yes gene_type:complete